jgi:hypothetical protein
MSEEDRLTEYLRLVSQEFARMGLASESTSTNMMIAEIIGRAIF